MSLSQFWKRALARDVPGDDQDRTDVRTARVGVLAELIVREREQVRPCTSRRRLFATAKPVEGAGPFFPLPGAEPRGEYRITRGGDAGLRLTVKVGESWPSDLLIMFRIAVSDPGPILVAGVVAFPDAEAGREMPTQLDDFVSDWAVDFIETADSWVETISLVRLDHVEPADKPLLEAALEFSTPETHRPVRAALDRIRELSDPALSPAESESLAVTNPVGLPSRSVTRWAVQLAEAARETWGTAASFAASVVAGLISQAVLSPAVSLSRSAPTKSVPDQGRPENPSADLTPSEFLLSNQFIRLETADLSTKVTVTLQGETVVIRVRPWLGERPPQVAFLRGTEPITPPVEGVIDEDQTGKVTLSADARRQAAEAGATGIDLG